MRKHEYFLAQSNQGSQRPNLDWLLSIDAPIMCQTGHLTCPRAIDVVATEEIAASWGPIPLRDNARTVVKGSEITIVQKRIIDEIGLDAVSRAFYIGEVSFTDRRSSSSYSSVVPRSNELVPDLRSNSREFEFEFCAYCGEPSYSIRSVSISYVLRTAISEEWEIYPGHFGFFLREDIMRKIKRISKSVQFDRVGVEEEPQDGLPRNLRDVPDNYVHRFKSPRK